MPMMQYMMQYKNIHCQLMGRISATNTSIVALTLDTTQQEHAVAVFSPVPVAS